MNQEIISKTAAVERVSHERTSLVNSINLMTSGSLIVVFNGYEAFSDSYQGLAALGNQDVPLAVSYGLEALNHGFMAGVTTIGIYTCPTWIRYTAFGIGLLGALFEVSQILSEDYSLTGEIYNL